MKIYCSACGHPNVYGSKKPNFCQNCGKGLNNSKKTAASQPPPEEEAEDLEEAETERVPEIKGLDVEFESGKIQGLEFGSVIGTVDPDEKIQNKSTAKKPRRVSKKARQKQAQERLQDFKKEAGTMRRSKDPE